MMSNVLGGNDLVPSLIPTLHTSAINGPVQNELLLANVSLFWHVGDDVTSHETHDSM